MRVMTVGLALCLAWLVQGALCAQPPGGAALSQVELFSPGIISGGANDGAPTFSPDGKTLFFERTNGKWAAILRSVWSARGWSIPTLAPFSGEYSDQQPAYAPDGNYLIFVSTRPMKKACAGCATRSSHLYRVDRTARGWSVPRELPEQVNIANRVFKPSIAANGDLFFMANVASQGAAKWRLFRSAFAHGAYSSAEPLPFSGDEDGDVDPYVAPDQSYIIFSSSHRSGNADSHEHLFVVRRTAAGWSAPQAIHYAGEDDADDGEASVSPDGKWLYFTSSRVTNGSVRRNRPGAEAALAQMNTWDNSNNNVWRLPASAIPGSK